MYLLLSLHCLPVDEESVCHGVQSPSAVLRHFPKFCQLAGHIFPRLLSKSLTDLKKSCLENEIIHDQTPLSKKRREP